MRRSKLFVFPALFIASCAFLAACSGPEPTSVASADELAALMEDAGYSCEQWKITTNDEDEPVREQISCGDGGLSGLMFKDSGSRQEHTTMVGSLYKSQTDSDVFRKVVYDYVEAENWRVHGPDEELAGVAEKLGLEVESFFD